MPGIEWRRVDQMEFVRQERTKQQEYLRAHETDPAFAYECKWVREWLSKSDEEHLSAGTISRECDVCGKNPRFIWHTEFSFCDEYECAMNLCDDCILKMADEIRKAQEEAAK